MCLKLSSLSCSKVCFWLHGVRLGCGLGWFVGPKFSLCDGLGCFGSVVCWVGLKKLDPRTTLYDSLYTTPKTIRLPTSTVQNGTLIPAAAYPGFYHWGCDKAWGGEEAASPLYFKCSGWLLLPHFWQVVLQAANVARFRIRNVHV